MCLKYNQNKILCTKLLDIKCQFKSQSGKIDRKLEKIRSKSTGLINSNIFWYLTIIDKK